MRLSIIGDAVLTVVFAVIFSAAGATYAQTSENSRVPRTLFYNSDGELVSNNEFVDIRMANPHYPDRTLKKTLDDGTVEFRLQKIPQEGMQAPAVAFTTLDGRIVSIADLRGKVVVLNFWFIGCPACLAEMPKLNNLRAKFSGAEDVLFLAATADDARDVRQFVKNERFDYVHAADAGVALKQFVFSGYPRNIVISKSGEIVYWRTTVKAWDKFESVVAAERARQ